MRRSVVGPSCFLYENRWGGRSSKLLNALRVLGVLNVPKDAPSVNRVLFLDASSHLYMRVCPSVGPSVGRSVGRSVGDAFVKNGKIDDFDRK